MKVCVCALIGSALGDTTAMTLIFEKVKVCVCVCLTGSAPGDTTGMTLTFEKLLASGRFFLPSLGRGVCPNVYNRLEHTVLRGD